MEKLKKAENNMAWREAIQTVLRKAPEQGFTPVEIVKKIYEQGLRTAKTYTPVATVSSEITRSIIDNGSKSPYIRVSRGKYRTQLGAKGGAVPAMAADQTKADLDGENIDDQDEIEIPTGLVFGLYWQRDWPNVNTGKTGLPLYGYQYNGVPVDFKGQEGIYLLHDVREIIYIGRARSANIGVRLKEHTVDRLAGRWNRFSWFGVLSIDAAKGTVKSGVPGHERWNTDNVIRSMEAVLIEAVEPRQNRRRGDGFSGAEYLQYLGAETSDPIYKHGKSPRDSATKNKKLVP